MIEVMHAMNDEAVLGLAPASDWCPTPIPPPPTRLGSNGSRLRPCSLESAATALVLQPKRGVG